MRCLRAWRASTERRGLNSGRRNVGRGVLACSKPASRRAWAALTRVLPVAAVQAWLPPVSVCASEEDCVAADMVGCDPKHALAAVTTHL